MANSAFTIFSFSRQSKFKIHCLMAAAFCFTIAGCALAELVRSNSYEGYAVWHSDGLGFEAGPGVRGEASTRYADTEITAYGQWADVSKYGHKNGYHYWYGAGVNQYITGDWFFSVVYGWHGYKSTPPTGKTWRKDGHAPRIGAGYDNGRYHLSAGYALPDGTVNDTHAVGLICELPVWEYVKLRLSYAHAWFLHRGRRVSDGAAEMGVGIKF